jgi:hypothetical protein
MEKYTKAMMVVERLRGGKTLSQACDEVYITRASVMKLAREDDKFKSVLEDAEREGQDTLAELLVTIDQQHPDPKMANVISRNIQWLLSKRRVADYGDRVQVDTNTTQDEAILSALNEAIKRIPVPEQPIPPAVIDAEVVAVDTAAAAPLPAAPENSTGSL